MKKNHFKLTKFNDRFDPWYLMLYLFRDQPSKWCLEHWNEGFQIYFAFFFFLVCQSLISKSLLWIVHEFSLIIPILISDISIGLRYGRLQTFLLNHLRDNHHILTCLFIHLLILLYFFKLSKKHLIGQIIQIWSIIRKGHLG